MNRTRRVLMPIVGLIGCACLPSVSARAATFMANRALDAVDESREAVLPSVPEHTKLAQLLEQELQDWRQRRDLIDARIADIDARLNEPKLTDAERKALEDQKSKLEPERKSADEWIKMIFERLIHVP